MYCNIPTEAFQEFLLVNTTYHQCLFVLDKKIRRGAFQLGKRLGGIRLVGLGFLGGVLFLRKKSFYVFLCPNQFLQGSYHVSRQSGIGLPGVINPEFYRQWRW